MKLAVFDFNSQPVRVDGSSESPVFIAADVCRVLEIGNSRQALSRLDEDEKGVISNDTLGGLQEMATVNESGLYSLIFTSRKPQAKAFKKWVTGTVLPQIRLTGRYDVREKMQAEPEESCTLAAPLRAYLLVVGALVELGARADLAAREVGRVFPGLMKVCGVEDVLKIEVREVVLEQVSAALAGWERMTERGEHVTEMTAASWEVALDWQGPVRLSRAFGMYHRAFPERVYPVRDNRQRRWVVVGA